MKFFVGLGMMLLAVGIFWGCFFKLTPWLVGLIPPCGGWEKLIGVGMYVLVGWFGGIAIPLVLFLIGVGIVVKDWR